LRALLAGVAAGRGETLPVRAPRAVRAAT
jgi:hypothetical protein